MRVYISADMEGATGVTHPEDAQAFVVVRNPPLMVPTLAH